MAKVGKIVKIFLPPIGKTRPLLTNGPSEVMFKQSISKAKEPGTKRSTVPGYTAGVSKFSG